MPDSTPTPAHDPADLIEIEGAGSSRVTLATQGAQVLSWRTAHEEHLYRSPISSVAEGQPVRGGVPICFPQFAARGPLAKHGFARNVQWRVAQAGAGGALLQLDASMVAPSTWPHRFELGLAVEAGEDSLTLRLQVRNTDTAPWAFTGALHTYLAVPDVRAASLHGLRGARYEDALAANALCVEHDDTLRIADELDRVYLATPPRLLLQRPGMPSLAIEQQGFTDTVVWNPGPRKAAALGDMPPQDWMGMLCVEAAVVAQPIELKPGASWVGTQRLQLAAS
jgi:glucose-6-phosphate 1-epimerase